MKSNIMVIGNDDANYFTIRTILGEEYRIHRISLKEFEAELAIIYKPCLIILNFCMTIDQWNKVKEYKLMKETRPIPVIFLSDYSNPDMDATVLLGGAVDYFSLPLRTEIVRAKVKNQVAAYVYQKKLKDIAMLDGLTAIPNRRSYDAYVEKSWEEAKRQQMPFSIAIIDIDCFKEYNDNYGHLQGDFVLQQVAHTLEENLPEEGGFVARYGGEEFVVVLLGEKENTAYETIEHLRSKVMELGILHHHSKANDLVTISAGGGTVIPSENTEFLLFMEEVDRKLYRAKGLGRNQVIWENCDDRTGQIEVFLFGHLSILSAKGIIEIHPRADKKIWVLLTYLIVNRYAHYTKEELLEAVFEHGEDRKNIDQLKVLFQELRMELEKLDVPFAKELVVIINGVYHWNNNYMCIVDSELFQNLYEQSKTGAETVQYDLAKKALHIYHSDFLENVEDIPWIVDLRYGFRGMYCDMVEIYCRRKVETKDYKGILTVCKKLLDQEEYDERIHYYYLLALIRLQEKEKALEHYETIVAMYYSRQGLIPSRRIVLLFSEIVYSVHPMRLEIERIRQDMQEEVTYGAYYCDYCIFQRIYQMEARAMIRSGKLSYLALISLDKAMHVSKKEEFLFLLLENLRATDVVCNIKKQEYIALLPNVKYKTGFAVMNRLMEQYVEKYGTEAIPFHYELIPVEATRSSLMETVIKNVP